MSRARKIGEHWFDVNKNSHKASVVQIKLLASAMDIDIDKILDEQLSQGQVIELLRKELGEGMVPEDIEERRERDKERRKHEPKCRICDRVGDSTRHHFVNRWMLKELSNYREVSQRTKCTIPLCVRDHRDLHSRERGDKSIVKFLDRTEKKFVNETLKRFRKEHRGGFDLLKKGDPTRSYEACLVQEWLLGKFD